MMFQAKILTRETTAIAGEILTSDQLIDAVDKFNASAEINWVTMGEWPGPRRPDPDKIAASATLHLENSAIIANIELLDTPYGNITTQLIEAGAKIYLRPLVVVVPSNSPFGMQLLIERLIIVSHLDNQMIASPMKQVQDWVAGEIHMPMFELIDKY